MPEIAAVFRSSGAWSDGGRNRRPGRGANSARRFGGSLSVISAMQADEEAVVIQLLQAVVDEAGRKVSRRKQPKVRGNFSSCVTCLENKTSRPRQQMSTLMNQCTNDDCERFTEGDCLPGKCRFKMNFRTCTDELEERGGSIYSPMSQTLLPLL